MTSNNLNILIIEDELLIAEMLKEILLELGHKVIAIAQNYAIAIEKLEKHSEINFAFIDINLNADKNGLDIAETINSSFKEIPFVFLTSYSDSKTVQEAVTKKPESYLVKPFTKSDLFIVLEIYLSKKPTLYRSFEIKDGQNNIKINHDAILWIKSENIYLEIKTKSKTYILRNSLDRFLEKINDPNFIKIHRSYIINIKNISSINKQFVFINEQKIPISRGHYEKLIRKFSE
jgi:two-component system, LytTR family, response regulator LytT